MKQVKDRYFYKIWALYIFLFSFGIHLNAKGRYLPEWKEYVVMQADMSSTITQVETLQSYLEQGIEAVMVKDDAILRKQATEKGMVILSQETLEIYQQRQKVKGADVIIFARLKSDTYIRYALEENCFLERLDCNIYGSSRWLNKYLEGTLEITTQLVAANKLRIDIRNLADIPLILKPIPQTSICLNELEPIELQGSARKVIFASLSDMTLSSYDLNVEVVNLFSTETNMPYVYNIPVKGMLFSKSESGVLNCAIIPQPKTIRSNTHSKFVINEQTCIQVATNKAKTEIHFLTDRLKQAASLTPEIKQFLVPKNNIIVFKELPKNTLGKEGYRLQVTEDSIEIEANEKNGFFYAIQTLLQLLPPEIYLSTTAIERSWEVPAVFIEDTPRFAYRGMHLDVSRHFYPVSFVKKYIDLLAMQKMNYFHWHLTDDQGWRIEIKRYPFLTEKGAWRDSTAINHPSSFSQPVFEKKRYGGYYTQEQIREVVAYAAEHHVTIVPEIDIPGHMLAALTAYPSLGCIQKGYQVGTQWGIYSDVLCAGNAACYTFLKDVMQEVIELFPGPYIHIGGDECPNERWKSCEKCQSWMRKNHISDEYALQSYVIEYVGKYLKKHHKRLIGWDEILEGGIGREAVIMSWRGVKGGITAAKAGNLVIMAPNTHMYLNHYQSNMLFEPLAHGRVASLEWVYSFNPIPDVLTPEEAKKVLGIQGNVWTEYLPTYQLVEYMAYPRASAVAEIGWSQPENRNWKDYLKRLQIQFERWRYYQVNCALHYKLP